MKYIHIYFENWCLINVWSVAFYLICCKCISLISHLIFYCSISRYENLRTPFLHNTANDCFYLCQNTCVSAKIILSPYLVQIVPEKWEESWFHFLEIRLWILITAANLKNTFTDQVHFCIYNYILNVSSRILYFLKFSKKKYIYIYIHVYTCI